MVGVLVGCGTIGHPMVVASGQEGEESVASDRGRSHSRNAKPVVRRGRNATGLTKTAGLPKEGNTLRRPAFRLSERPDLVAVEYGKHRDGKRSRRGRLRRLRCDAWFGGCY